MQRVVSTPDFIFTASPGFNNPWGFNCTGTTNWINNGAINGSSDSAGPGTIVPQVNISFQEYGLFASVITGDVPPFNTGYASTMRWGSFDGSTNPPAIFPAESGAGVIDTLQAQLSVLDTNYNDSGIFFDLEASVNFEGTATFQTSSNLVDWASQVTITNFGLPVSWSHYYSLPQGFFRIAPAQ